MINWSIGDCVDLLKNVPDTSFDFMFTDPPFGIGYVSNYYVGDNPHNAIVNDAAVDHGFNTAWLAEASRVLKEKSAVMIFTRWDVWGEWCDLISPYWDIKNMIVWVKNNWSAGDLTGNVGNQHELIIFAARGGFKINGFRHPNVWNFDRVPPKRHPTEKPVEMIERGITMCTEPSGSVLDPFLGSGTTLEAARRTGRSCYGCEIEPMYEKLYDNRSLNHTPSLFDF